MNATPSNLGQHLIDALAIVFFAVVVIVKPDAWMTCAAMVSAIAGGRLGLRALAAKPAGDAASAPAVAPATAAPSSSPPPVSGVLFLLVGLAQLASMLVKGRGA